MTQLADTTHQCPAPGCEHRCSFERFACREHWHAIGYDRRARLARAWARYPGTDEYFRARAECLRALGVPEDEIAELNAGTAAIERGGSRR
jgi:hypothetical protein